MDLRGKGTQNTAHHNSHTWTLPKKITRIYYDQSEWDASKNACHGCWVPIKMPLWAFCMKPLRMLAPGFFFSILRYIYITPMIHHPIMNIHNILQTNYKFWLPFSTAWISLPQFWPWKHKCINTCYQNEINQAMKYINETSQFLYFVYASDNSDTCWVILQDGW